MKTENNHIEVNGTEYGFRIEPYYNKLLVEIYKVSPIESDYIKARKWADNHILYILNANRKL